MHITEMNVMTIESLQALGAVKGKGFLAKLSPYSLSRFRPQGKVSKRW